MFTTLVMTANDQAYAAIAEARKAGAVFTPITIMYGSGTAYIDGARSF